MGLLIVDDKEWADSLKDCNISDSGSSQDIVESQNDGCGIQSNDHPKTTISHEILNRGRGSDNTNVPEGIREIIAEESISGASVESLQKAFGVSPSSISAYKNGSTSTATYRQRDERLIKVRHRVAGKANKTLVAALEALGDKDFTELKAKDISSVAKDMAAIVEKIGPKQMSNVDENNKQVHLHIWSPRMKQIDDYESIEVNVLEE